MVLEQFLDRKLVLKHAPFTFALSLIYVFGAYLIEEIFFPGQSLAIALLLTIALVPSLHHIIAIEERIERAGSKHFWKRHHTIIKSYLGMFFGILAGFLLLGVYDPSALNYQTTQLEQEHLSDASIQSFLQGEYNPTPGTAMAVFSHNVFYMLAGFALSIFYGAGAVFLIVYNASFFAAFIMEIFARWSMALQLTMVSLVHLIPESAAFILTAISGATLSRALIHEKLKDQHFKNVLQNCVKMLIIAVILLLIAAFIETYITANAFSKLI